MKAVRAQQPRDPDRLPNVPGVQWFAPEEDLEGELVLSGDAGARIASLAEELRHIDRFLRARIDPPTRMLFSGPTGTGKTLVARWLGWRLKLPVAVTDISDTASTFVNGTGQNLGRVFDGVAKVTCILFLDEIDGLCSARGGSGEGAKQAGQATTVLLQKLDWLDRSRIVIAATNHPELVDPALRRRLFEQIAFEPPTREARRKMLEHWLGAAPVPSEVLDELAAATEGLGGAELRARAMALGRRAIMAAPPPPPPPALRPISGAPPTPGAPSREDLARGAQQVLRALEIGRAGS